MVIFVRNESYLHNYQYYLYMFNNNFGTSITNPNYDWKQIEGVGDTSSTNVNSKYYKYLVDENKRTYALVDSFDVPYSPYISSAQNTATTTIIDSGKQLTFLEYDETHTLIQSYKMKGEKFIYRVYKYTFDGFYF